MPNSKRQPAAQPVRVIGCGMIAREILDVCRANGLDHVSLTCLPADFHHHPERIAPAVDTAIQRARNEGFEQIFVGYADCGTGGDLDRVCERHGVERIAGPHCFSFYIGNAAFADADEDDYLTTFFMTDFLARHFDTFLIRPLGLDRHPELRDMYFAHYTRLLYIAQTDDADLTEKARHAADRLGLAFERRLTGYGDLAPALVAAASPTDKSL
ncbi:MAG: DUF1638 domain-containing protein [Roseitalea sp.]|jgi:hypothetical protein|uniref:DUF1638 domain-containing protein n=1 Tax=Oceaniradius stylonematis TaxID=2184161 RepID=A0A3A8AJ26_9HYPH|nr:DUF1638 domain-containing protein [Oceaniradius stylonematis]MBO6551391.1 DUF1638 domain-containing protein [Roseitalea sp.]MBO6952229.1 DUF1638 domain-containing protein [Rhizobiaceae bacterium]RNC90740.1 MAG: DUF1638 domain-containing protein [Oricola sp.]MBO6591925.1 DUF1638 domain-containing protein [Roseitalea sp.]MBO6598180.1 DUF1638 domain-containing protein [Roseitalea sp.]